MASKVPESVGKYIVEKQLGQGAMGVVYLCSQPIVGRKVAVKRVQSAALDKPELLERFLREASAAGSLHHENIVVVHTVEEDDEGHPFIVMEYLDGQDLGDMLHDEEELPRLRQRLEIAFQVASALEHAHQNSVVHRDVKPSNVIVLPGGRVKLVDFGIARIGGSKMTMDGSLMGTPQYMAPEQWEGKLADHRSDIYAFGILLFELAAGHVPYDSDNPLAIGTKILDKNNPPPSVEKLFDGSAPPPEINEIIAQCTARDPGDRPETFAPVRAALQELLTELPEQDSFASMAVEQVQARMAKAREQLELGQWKRAQANLRRARKQATGDVSGLTALERQVDVVRLCSQGNEAVEQLDFAAADKAAAKALEIDPESALARSLVERVATARSINELVEKLRVARSALDFNRVTELSERILKLDPEHGYALRLRDEAAELRRTNELNERLDRARQTARSGKLDEAIAAVQAVAKDAPDFAEAADLLDNLQRQRDAKTEEEAAALRAEEEARAEAARAASRPDGQATVMSTPGDATVLASPKEDATILATPGRAQDAATVVESGADATVVEQARTADATVVDQAADSSATVVEEPAPPKSAPKKPAKKKAKPAPAADAAPQRTRVEAQPAPAKVGGLPIPIIAAAAVLLVAVAAWLFWPSGDDGAPVAGGTGTLRVNAAVAAVVQIESAENGPLDLDPADDACPGMACPPFAVALPPGEYTVRWRLQNGPADSWSAPETVRLAAGQSLDVFWAQEPPGSLLESGSD